MQVKNIECQIAQAQLRRYLTGEEMPNNVVSELETHLKHCPECMDAAQTLRESLKGVLSRKIAGKPEPKLPEPAPRRTETPVVQRPAEPEEPAQAATHAVVQTPADILGQPDSDFKPANLKKGSNMKTLAYSGALALVLVLMSTVFKDPTMLFGPRASSIVPDTLTVAGPAATDTEPTDEEKPPETNTVEPPTDPVPTNIATNTNNETKPAAESSKPLEPFRTNGLIVADSLSGTHKVETAPVKKEPKPQPRTSPRKSGGVGTLKVYPPDK
ncbi:MAG: hypothetical protein WD716_06395 [Fimbriimonadaceae bacterium]